jgi:hypothetical protein
MSLDQLKRAIAHEEGADRVGTVPQRLNNPGDLVYAHQPNAKPHPITGKDGKVRIYAEFDTPEHGWDALERQIRLDASRGLTLAEFVRKYAPASDANNPTSYLAGVMRAIGVTDAKIRLSAIIASPS